MSLWTQPVLTISVTVYINSARCNASECKFGPYQLKSGADAVAESENIGAIAEKISDEIFKWFGWNTHPLKNENFPCTNPEHTVKESRAKRATKNANGQSSTPKQKKTHPGDVIFSYDDPYLGWPVYLHTDLKSYAKESVSTVKARAAIESLAMTVQCAQNSQQWREQYSVPDDKPFEIRGLLFVYNHDNKYEADFGDAIRKTDLGTIPVAPKVYIHFLGPEDINRLFTIANDLMRLQHQKTLPEKYSFYYPDLVTWRRQGDVFLQPATIEVLTAPYTIITYETGYKTPPGYLIYYNRPGSSADEFVYFLDSLSRYQMLEPNKLIRIRVVHKAASAHMQSYFKAAKDKYSQAWGFDESRTRILEDIQIEEVAAVFANYKGPQIGWRSA